MEPERISIDTEFSIGAIGAFFLGATYLGGVMAAGLMYGNRLAVSVAIVSAGAGYLCQVTSLLMRSTPIVAGALMGISVLTAIGAGLLVIFGG